MSSFDAVIFLIMQKRPSFLRPEVNDIAEQRRNCKERPRRGRVNFAPCTWVAVSDSFGNGFLDLTPYRFGEDETPPATISLSERGGLYMSW